MSAPPGDGHYVMYGAEFSLYSGKLRSYLRKKGIPFDERTATARRYRRFIILRTGVRFIPVLHTPDDEVLQDTSVIIDALERRHPEPSVYPATPAQRVVSLLMELLGDEWLLVPAMHYRWNKPGQERFLYREFGSMLFPWLPPPLQRAIGKRIAARFAGFVPRLGITEATQDAVERRYEQLLGALERHFAEVPYLLGERPTIADFGLIAPFYAHLYRDPWPGRHMREHAPGVARWVERMMAPEPARGALLPDDRVPDSLLDVMRPMCSDYMPILADTVRRLEDYLEVNGPGELPRTIGTHAFSIDGDTGERIVLPYSVWMLQRVQAAHAALDGEARARSRATLESLGARELVERPAAAKLVRHDNRNHVEAVPARWQPAAGSPQQPTHEP